MSDDRSFKIVQLSDVYIDGSGKDFLRTQALFENLVLNDKPNLVVIGGDIVSPDIAQDEF